MSEQGMGVQMEVGVSTFVRPGQTESGDLWLARHFAGGALVGVVDGCGHGPEAASAAKIALAVLEANPENDLTSLIGRCHEELKSTRGVVMSVASFHVSESTLTWIGVGNVEGVLFRSPPEAEDEREMLLLRAGVVGHNLPPLQATVVPVRAGDTLIFATDGVRADFTAERSAHQAPQSLADEICNRYGKRTDDTLVVVARYLGRVL